MKKILLGLAVAATALLSSCSMDTKNFGVMDQDSAIESLKDVRSYTNGLYMDLRSITAGTYMVYPEIQADMFVGTVINGNRIGLFSAGTFSASDGDLETFYQDMYNVINDANFIIPKVEAMLEDDQFDADQKTELKEYLGDAYFTRAYCYWYILDHFCRPSDANSLGVQLWLEYSPSGDRSTYPGRSSMSESLAQINGDLNNAFSNLKAYEDAGHLDYCGPNASRLSSYAVAALQSRLALESGDNTTALSKAEYVINGPFALTELDDYIDMWTYDEGDELIFVPYSNNTESCPTTGVNWLTNATKQASDYIPTAKALMMYDNDDIRFDAFYDVYNLSMEGSTVPAYVFNKFPGNPTLWRTSTNNFMNRPKPFRLSELYLIAAEACATDGPAKNETKANDYINTLRSKRIANYTSVSMSGNTLVQAIREERAKELIGEGFRLSDLRRWNTGFTRDAGFDAIGLSYITPFVKGNTTGVIYNSTDRRFVWPIPQFEFTVNPNIDGQQNPGY